MAAACVDGNIAAPGILVYLLSTEKEDSRQLIPVGNFSSQRSFCLFGPWNKETVVRAVFCTQCSLTKGHLLDEYPASANIPVLVMEKEAMSSLRHGNIYVNNALPHRAI